jgi:signal peptidase II
MTKLAKTIVLIILVAMTAGCDHVSKHMATKSLGDGQRHSFLADTFRLEYAENTGGMLSMGADLSPGLHTAIFKVGVGAALFAMAVAAIVMQLTPLAMIGLSFSCAGGLSNWIDRIATGSVVDFLNVGIGSLRSGIFNVADLAVLLGGLLLLLSFRPSKKLKT